MGPIKNDVKKYMVLDTIVRLESGREEARMLIKRLIRQEGAWLS